MSTKEELYEKATELEIEGRSTMNKDELEAAIAESEGSEGPEGGANSDNVGRENYAIEDASEEPDYSNVAPETVSATLGSHHGGVLPSDGRIIAPMEDPVGTVVTNRDKIAAEARGEDEDGNPVEPLSVEETTTTINGERAASGDPEVTWANIAEARAAAEGGARQAAPEDADDEEESE